MVDSVQPSNTLRTTMYSRGHFGATTASPSAPAFRADIFSQSSVSGNSQYYQNTSPTAERHSADRNGTMPALAASTSDPLAFGTDSRIPSAILIRKLPQNLALSGLRGMLLFSNELIDTEFIHSIQPEDQGFLAAVARFQTPAGAVEAIQKLNGKPNTSQDANMVVEPYRGSSFSAFDRRNTIDGTASRTQTSSASSAGSVGPPSGRSRFNSAFQPPEKVSPPLATPSSSANGEFSMSGSSQHLQSLFSPQSPLSNGVNGQHRVSGKSMINNDSVDDETGELLKDPVAYARSGQQAMSRRATNPQIPVSRFASLSISTANGMSNGINTNGYTSPRAHAMAQTTSPVAPQPPNANTTYLPNFPRAQYPPVNPADQNPPCNTLYVGNLPIDTNEDELKTLFSKVRGYKRLCFRTKHNGPMCFVEFEDTSFATKALHELYGHPLHNSVKGGIRLSFSKNPLGVRAGQTSGLGPHAVMSPQAMAPGYAGMATNGNYSSVSGPPPGLGTPAAMVNGNPYRKQSMQPMPALSGMDAMFSTPFQMPNQGNHMSQMPARSYSGGVPPIMGNGTYGRDSRNTHSRADFNEGRNGYHDARGGFEELSNGYHEAQNGYSDPRNGYEGCDYRQG